MSIRTYRNNRGMTASTDGTRWWASQDADDASISIGELQPVSALFPEPAGISFATAAKARCAFMSALRKAAPTVAPDNDAERAILRAAWDDAVKFSETHDVHEVGVPVFDTNLLLVGTADALCKDGCGAVYSYCYTPNGFEYGGELNAVVRMIHRGFPVDAEDDANGTYSLRELSRALLAVVMRDSTEWYAKKRNQF